MNKFETSTRVDFLRTHLKQVVIIHQAMFEKLLFEENADVDLDLAELFHDVGRTYLRISQQITDRCSSKHSVQD
jgi:hypothetical protein